MKIIILGAGQVGSTAAQQLAREQANDVTVVDTRDDVLRAVRDISGTIFHPCGTARMGTDGAAVVDPTLKVIGLEGLRIVDASVIPAPISGGLSAPTLMIAEKGAYLSLAERRARAVGGVTQVRPRADRRASG